MLVVDGDWQMDASRWLGVDEDELGERATLLDVLLDRDRITEAIASSTIPGVDLLPAPEPAGIRSAPRRRARCGERAAPRPRQHRGPLHRHPPRLPGRDRDPDPGLHHRRHLHRGRHPGRTQGAAQHHLLAGLRGRHRRRPRTTTTAGRDPAVRRAGKRPRLRRSDRPCQRSVRRPAAAARAAVRGRDRGARRPAAGSPPGPDGMPSPATAAPSSTNSPRGVIHAGSRSAR